MKRTKDFSKSGHPFIHSSSIVIVSLLIAVKKQADIAVGEGRWDGCLTMDSCNPSGGDDRGWAGWRHLVAVVFFVPARCAR